MAPVSESMGSGKAWSDSAGEPQGTAPQVTLPAWLMSLGLHGLLLALCAILFRVQPQGAGEDLTGEVGIVLRQPDAPREQAYLDETEVATESEVAPAAERDALDELLDAPPVANPAASMPEAPEVIGVSPAAGEGAGTGSRLTAGPRGMGKLPDGRTRTGVFGTVGEGRKFVYVFDRSGSMGGVGKTALDAAKAELLASLKNLESTHQFQIIFYNDETSMFVVDGRPGKLAFGDDRTKEQAERWVRAVIADGATEHEKALNLALKLQPDVVFFLTDADQPVLAEPQLARIAKSNGGRTVINSIEFGVGPPLSGINFLIKLAQMNGGQHAYVDIAALGVGR